MSGIQQRVPEARSRAVKGECDLGIVKNKASETSLVRSVKIEPHSLVRKAAQGEQVPHLMGMPRIFLSRLKTDLRALCIPGRRSTTESHPPPPFPFYFVRQGLTNFPRLASKLLPASSTFQVVEKPEPPRVLSTSTIGLRVGDDNPLPQDWPHPFLSFLGLR